MGIGHLRGGVDTLGKYLLISNNSMTDSQIAKSSCRGGVFDRKVLLIHVDSAFCALQRIEGKILVCFYIGISKSCLRIHT